MERGMQKEEFEAILGDRENTPDLGPIENYLHAVATEPKLPDLAVRMCTARIEEAAPKLRAVLLRAADGEVLSDDESLLLFRGLHTWAERVTGKHAGRCCVGPSMRSTPFSAMPSLRAWPKLSPACSMTASTRCWT
jgi:hypothetical protein